MQISSLLIQHEDGGGDSSSDMEDEYCPSSADDEGPEESDSDEDYTSISEGGSESGILVILYLLTKYRWFLWGVASLLEGVYV